MRHVSRVGNPKVAALNRDVAQSIVDHWVTYKEPYSLAILGHNYNNRLKSALGFDVSMGWYCETLAKTGFLVILKAKHSKRWVFIGDVWRSFNQTERSYWLDWIQTAIDPSIESSNLRKASTRSTLSQTHKDSED